MMLLNKRERDAILDRFPRAEIVSTRHRFYLVGSDAAEPARLLMELRGITPPPSRRDRTRTGSRPRTW